MKVLTNLDLNKNELQNVRLQQLSADPTGANLVAGMIWMNTSSSPYVVKYYNGTETITLGAIDFETTVSNIKMNGTASVGLLSTVARADHIHPSDTSRVPTSRTINGYELSSNVELTAEDIELESEGISLETFINDGLGGAAYKGVDTSISSGSTSTSLPTSQAVASYVSSAIGAIDAMRFKGTIGTGGTVTTLPTTGVKVGDTYRVITAGTYAGQACEIGDLIIATATTPTWTVAQTNIDGAITSISQGTGISVTGSGSSRTIGLASGVITGGSKGETQDRTLSWGGTFKVTGETVDTYGRTIDLDEYILTIPNSVASASAAGLMSANMYNWLAETRFIRHETVKNPRLTQTGGVCTWTISDNFLDFCIVEVYEVSQYTRTKVIADVSHNNNSGVITISIISPTDIDANKYEAVIIGYDKTSVVG